jgi:hypothetical protein
MADFALWGEAVGRGLGWQAGDFTSVYGNNRFEASATALENSPIGNLLLQVAPNVLELECSPTELLEMLAEKAGKKVARSAAWPKTPRNFTDELRRLAPQLRMHGLSVVYSRNRSGSVVKLVSAGFLAVTGQLGDVGGQSSVSA